MVDFSHRLKDGSIKFFRHSHKPIDPRIETALEALLGAPDVSRISLGKEKRLLIPRKGFVSRGYDLGLNAVGVRINAGDYSRKAHLRTDPTNSREVEAYVRHLHKNRNLYFPKS